MVRVSKDGMATGFTLIHDRVVFFLVCLRRWLGIRFPTQASFNIN